MRPRFAVRWTAAAVALLVLAIAAARRHDEVRVPLSAWTSAAAKAGSRSPALFAVREALRPFALSDAANFKGSLVTLAPLDWADAFDVVAESAEWDALRTAAEAGRGPLPADVAAVSVAAIADALNLDASGGPWTPPPLQSLSVVRRCDRTPPGELWETLLQNVPCDVPLRRSEVADRMSNNVRALAAAPSLHGATADLSLPGVTRQAVLRQVPVPPIDPALMVMNVRTKEVADAAGRNDPAAVRAALNAPAFAHALPGVLTAHGVVVNPNGMLQAVRPNRARRGTAEGYEGVLVELFDPEPEAARNVSPDRTERHLESAMGGPEPLRDLRRRAPDGRFVHFWPPYAGPDLAEVPYPPPGGGCTFVSQLVMPHDDDTPEPHEAVMAWDREALNASGTGPVRLHVLDEVVVVVPPADNYYWFSADFVGRIYPLVPYLKANPGVLVHVPRHFARRWAPGNNDTLPYAVEWLAHLGLADRLVSGRVAARTAHLLDKPLVGARTHPVHLLALRDAMRSLAPEIDVEHPGRANRVILVDRSAASSRGQPPSELAALSLLLRSYALDPIPFPGNLSVRASLALFASSSAVLAPHGSGLLNALAMRAGSALAETVPAGHEAAGWYYLQLAHYAGLHYRRLPVPGDRGTEARGGTAWMLWAACGEHAGRVAGCNATAPVPPHDRMGLPKVVKGIDECLPPEAGGDAWTPTPGEPVHALRALEPGFNLTSRDGRNVSGIAPWVSIALPPERAVGVALVFGTACNGPAFASRMPLLRGLIRALERRGLMPVAVPLGLLDDSKCAHQDLEDSCGNFDLRVTAVSAAAALAHVRRARGLAAGQRVPVLSFGLSSGSRFSGVVVRRMRVDAAVLQMAVPDLNATLVQEGGASLREDRACAARLEEEVVAALGPERGRLGMPELRGKQAVPPLWLTGSVANGMDGYNIAGLRTALLRAGVPEKRIVTDAWMPSGVCGGTFAEEAPWVFSRAAGGMVVEALRSVGLLVEHPGADLALRDYQPACANGTGRAGAPPLAACPEGSALLHPRHDLAWDNNGEIAGPLESATGQMMSALSFPHPLPTRGPLFYAAAGDPEFPAGATARVLRPHRGLPDCQVPSDADLSGRLREKGSKGKEECAFALDTWYMARQYVMLRLKGMLGLHEYTKGEHWDEMGGWMAGWAGEASQEG